MSGSSRFSRGGAGRGVNRMVHTPLGRGMLPFKRGQPAGAKEKGRPEESSIKGRGVAMKGNSIGAGSAVKNPQGEDFQLASCQEQGAVPLYAMAIRLTPGMLETFKRLEELGETAMMKFGVNDSGNMIKVGDHEFRFSSAPEPGHLCDIFEEQQRGEDGNGLLVETGAVWRKLSVIRTLSASDKATVKARSVEAERQQKARKAIVLDHNNSLMNNKAATAGDANGRRAPVMTKGKKEPPQKKRKIVATAPVIPPLSVVKTRPMPPTIEKPPVPAVALKSSKVSSPPDGPSILSRPPPSQGSAVPLIKPKSAAAEEAGGSAKMVSATQKDKVSSPALALGGETATVAKAAGVVNMSELRNCLITLLVDNPKGMTIKAVEKALGEAMPNVRPDKKQIEKVIKAIASYHAPGKYMLKDGVEKGGFAKPSPGSGSSPETPLVDSPPLGDLPALMENVPEAHQEAAVYSGEEKSVPFRADVKRTDGTGRNSSLPLRGGESAVSRAIRRAGEMVAEKRSGLERSGTALGSSAAARKLEEQSLKESTAAQEMAVADIDVGGDESPVAGSPEHDSEGKVLMEVDIMDEDPPNLASPPLLGAEGKKENVDGDGSDSDSDSSSGSGESGSDSDSESASGSGSGSGSDTDSEGGSSSGSEEENTDVDIISDDEGKPVAAADEVAAAEAPKAKSKSKDGSASLERQESRAQRQSSRSSKKGQKLKGSDASVTPLGSEDADIGDGVEGADISNFFDQDTAAEKEAKGGNSEEEVDVVSCGEDTPSPPEHRIASPAADPDIGLLSADFTGEVQGGQDGNAHPTMPARSGSESDHSIEEYETRAETSGVRRARVKAIGDQKDDSGDRKLDGTESVISPRSKGTKAEGTPHSIERESKSEAPALAPTTSKSSDLANGPTTSREHLLSGGAPLRLDDTQKSLLGTPPLPRDGLVQGGLPRMYRDGTPVKGKAKMSERKNVKTGEMAEKGPLPHRGPQRFNGMRKSFGGNRDTAAKVFDGFSKPSEEPGLMGKGPEFRETFTTDRTAGKGSQDGEILERPDVHSRRQNNREAGLLAKPGKTSELNRGKAGREPKQLKKPVGKPDGLRRDELSDRAGASSEFGEKPLKDTEFQRRPPRDGEPWRKSPKLFESDNRMASDNEAHSARQKDLDAELAESLRNVSKMASDLEVGELRDVVAGDDLRARDSMRQDAAKARESTDLPSRHPPNKMRMASDLEVGEWRDIVAEDDLRARDSMRQEAAKARESTDLSSRHPPNKLHISPDKDKQMRNTGKPGDIKRRSPADLKKQQQLAKKEVARAEAPNFLRDNLRPASGQKSSAGYDERLEMGNNNRTVEATRFHGDPPEKHVEGRNGKRPPEDAGIHDLGRPLKRTAFEQSQAAAAAAAAATKLERGESDSLSHRPDKVSDAAGKLSAVDVGSKAVSADGVVQHALGTSSKAAGDSGRVLAVKGKAQDAADKEAGDKRGSAPDGGKHKTPAGVLGSGTKRDLQSNGKKRSVPADDGKSKEFFAPYLKATAEVKGPISQYDQFMEYCREYREKYPVYVRLNTILESDKEDFENFSRDITVAKQAEDKNKLGIIYGKVRNNYKICSKRFKRMSKAFFILHDELKAIKQRCHEYAGLQKS